MPGCLPPDGKSGGDRELGSRLEHRTRHRGQPRGLLAARVLADRFDEVIIVERDSFPDEAVSEKVCRSHGTCTVLLARGAQILDGLLPGFLKELEAEGAIQRSLAGRRRLAGGRRLGQARLRGLPLYSSRREMVEHVVRRRVTAMPNVRRIGAA